MQAGEGCTGFGDYLRQFRAPFRATLSTAQRRRRIVTQAESEPKNGKQETGTSPGALLGGLIGRELGASPFFSHHGRVTRGYRAPYRSGSTDLSRSGEAWQYNRIWRVATALRAEAATAAGAVADTVCSRGAV